MFKQSGDKFIVDPESKAVLNNDEQAWLNYKQQRDSAIAIKRLQKQVDQLLKRVAKLEERLNETTTSS